MKIDIPEGADCRQMPSVFGYGRVCYQGMASVMLNEHYATLRLLGWRYFVAWGKYNGRSYSFRHWLQRAC